MAFRLVELATLCVDIHDCLICLCLCEIFKLTYMIKEKASCSEVRVNYDIVETEQDNMCVILSINIISIK